jgi:long-chain acyl-CoA synthetase
VAINDDLPKLFDNLAQVRPTLLVAVPRIFNRIYDSVHRDLRRQPGFLQRIVRGGIRGAIKRAHGEPLKAVERAELAFDEQVVFGKIREKLGGRLRYVISASATLGREVAEFVDALGLPVYEGYGLTETSPIVTVNSPGYRRLGSVGRTIPGVRIEIDDTVGDEPPRGEIIVHGPNVMLGYHERPEENASAFTEDGGFRTGDLGYVDDEGFLFVTGRIKEQYKLENGKYVMPSSLEERLTLSPYVANVMIHGDGRAYDVALVVIDEPAVREWASRVRIVLGPDPTSDPRVRGLIEGELERCGAEFKAYEKARAFALIRDEFTQASGLLTPTLKLKRREVVARYRDVIEGLYRQRQPEEPEVSRTSHAA